MSGAEIAAGGVVVGPRKMSGDEYMDLLLERQREWIERRGGAVKFPPLLTHFIRDGDVGLVELPEPVPRRKSQPRRYRPASFWRERRARIVAEMEGLAVPLVGDRAAAGGVALGLRRTRRVAEREDRRLARFVVLRGRLEFVELMLVRAVAREGGG